MVFVNLISAVEAGFRSRRNVCLQLRGEALPHLGFAAERIVIILSSRLLRKHRGCGGQEQ